MTPELQAELEGQIQQVEKTLRKALKYWCETMIENTRLIGSLKIIAGMADAARLTFDDNELRQQLELIRDTARNVALGSTLKPDQRDE
jgi:hypothetical protein